MKANVSKILQDHNPLEDVDVPLGLAALVSAETRPTAPVSRPKKHATRSRRVPAEQSTLPTPSFSMTHHWWDRRESSMVIMFGNQSLKLRTTSWKCSNSSAKRSQTASMQGLRVGAHIDLTAGCHLLMSEGRRKAMEVIEPQQPKIIHMAPARGPGSQLQNIHDPADTYQKRRIIFLN